MRPAPNFPSQLIRASAGTGKTFALTNRYLALIAAGESPEKILATTFTRKAAGEIRERIIGQLARAAKSSMVAKEVGAHIGDPRFTSNRAAELLKDLVLRQHRLNIGTLDSIFAIMARSFSFELGLEQNWKLADAALEGRLRREAVRRMLNGIPGPEVAQLMRLLNYGQARRSVHVQLEPLLAQVYNIFQETNVSQWAWLEDLPQITSEEVDQYIQACLDLEAPLTKQRKPDQRWLKAFTTMANHLMHQDWLGLLGSGIVKNILVGKREYYSQTVPDKVFDLCQSLLCAARAKMLSDLARQNSATYNLIQRYAQELSKLRMERGSFSFDDIRWFLAKAVEDNDLTEMYYRLDGRLSHILLDEFQDTSREEWTVLEPMVEEVLSKAGTEYSFFCVGDVKQAIYGWRGGVAEIFDTLDNRWGQLSKATLDKSYRCSEAVIATVNRIFGSIGDNPVWGDRNGPALNWQQRFVEHKTARDSAPGYVCMQVVEPPPKGQPGSTVYDEAVRLICKLQAQHPGVEIGVLVRRKKTVARLIFELKHCGVVASEEGGNPLTDSPAVLIVLALLHLADHPGDMQARFQVARSPLGVFLEFADYSDTKGALRLSRFVRQRVMEGLRTALMDWVTALIPHCTERDSRRLLQLVELGMRFDSEGFISLSEFIEFVKAERVESATAAQVRVMTIHQSKGLEFPIVVLPELDTKILGGHHEAVMCYRSNMMEAPQRVSRVPVKEVVQLDTRLVEMRRQEDGERIKEALSLLYVALTRAADMLYILVESGSGERNYPCSAAGILRAALAVGVESDSVGVLYEMGDPSIKLAGVGCAVDCIEPDLSTLHKLIGSSGQILYRNPSKAAQQQSAANLLHIGNRSTQRRGVVFHYLLEQISWVEDGVPSRVDLERYAKIVGAFGPDLVEQFLDLLERPSIRKVLSRTEYDIAGFDGVHVLREYPFIYRRGDEIVEGIIDRLVLLEKRGVVVGAEVIDFKSGSAGDKSLEGIQARANSYRPQLELYQQAAAKLAKLPVGAVATKVVLLDDDLVLSL